MSGGGIEDRIEKIKKLLSVMADDFLTRNPDRLDEVVRTVDCSGLGHKLLTDLNRMIE